MENSKNYIQLNDFELYKLARELSRLGWSIYEKLDWQTKKVIGDQFITSTDSFGANVTEGYARFHYLDKIKFMYNARGSLIEASDYWLELFKERKFIDQVTYDKFKNLANESGKALNGYIKSLYKLKNGI